MRAPPRRGRSRSPGDRRPPSRRHHDNEPPAGGAGRVAEGAGRRRGEEDDRRLLGERRPRRPHGLGTVGRNDDGAAEAEVNDTGFLAEDGDYPGKVFSGKVIELGGATQATGSMFPIEQDEYGNY